MTLYEAMTNWLVHQQSKHQLGEGYVETYINDLTQYEFLKELSDALELMTKQTESNK